MTSSGCAVISPSTVPDTGPERPAERSVLATGVAGREDRAHRNLPPLVAQDEQRGGRQRDGSDRGVRRDDLQARIGCLVETAHLAERVGGRVAAAPVVVDAAGPAVDVDPDVVELQAAVEPGQWMAHHRLGGREFALYPRSVSSLTGSSTRCDPQIPARRPVCRRSRAARRPVVDGRRADAGGPGVVVVVGWSIGYGCLSARLPAPSGSKTITHTSATGPGRRQQQCRPHPQRLRAVGVVRADESALVVGRLTASRNQHPILER